MALLFGIGWMVGRGEMEGWNFWGMGWGGENISAIIWIFRAFWAIFVCLFRGCCLLRCFCGPWDGATGEMMTANAYA